MRCPFGYDHSATWRCYVVFAIDWLSGRWPESWPYWTYRPLMWVLIACETDKGGSDAE